MEWRPALWFLLFASLLDALFTDTGLRVGGMVEANPLMRYIYEHAYVLFYPIKIALPCLLLFILPKLKTNRSIRFLLPTSVMIYGFVLFLHMCWMAQYVVIV